MRKQSGKITQEMKFEFNERAAIKEYEGRMPRARAELEALQLMQWRYNRKFKLEDFEGDE